MMRKDKFRICALLIAIMMAFGAVFTFAEGEADLNQEETAAVREEGPAPQDAVPAAAEPAPEPAAAEAPVQEVPQEAPQEMIQEAAPVQIPEDGPAETETVPADPAPVEIPAEEEPAPAEPEEEASGPEAAPEAEAEEPETEEEAPQPPEETDPAAAAETTDPAAEPESSEAEEPAAEAESSEAEEPVPFTGIAEIKPDKEYEPLFFGKETTLKAVVRLANKEYTIRWETRIIEKTYDDPDWTKITKDKKFEFRKEVQRVEDKSFAVDQFLTVKQLDEDDVKREFRLVLTDIETNEEIESEIYRFPAITEEPEEAEEIADRRIELSAEWEKGTPTFETPVTFSAVLYGYEDVAYRIQWQHSTDGKNWEDIPGAEGDSYTVIATEENYLDFWRAAVTVE